MTILDILASEGLIATRIDVDTLYFDFTKISHSYYETNALQHDTTTGEYIVTIEREAANRWVVFAEEHEPCDITAMGYPAVYPTLEAAKVGASEFARFFQETVWQAQCDEDPED